MELWQIPKFSKIRATLLEGGENVVLTFHHIDGMYSYCTIDNDKTGNPVVHLAAWTSLRKVGELYEIIDRDSREEK